MRRKGGWDMMDEIPCMTGSRFHWSAGEEIVKKYLVILLILVVMLGGVLAVRTAIFRSRQIIPPPFTPLQIDAEAVAERLRRAIQIPTISQQEKRETDLAQFDRLHALLEEAFPGVHATLVREKVNGHALLYTWPGSDLSLAPIIFLAHQDVVPVAPGTEDAWTRPAFSGEVADGFVWGRGTLDDKGNLMGLLEAAEALLAAGFTPDRTIYFAFGHDEEVGGELGALAVATLLEERGVKAFFCFDEGLAITEGIIPGIKQPVALVGTAEKGYLSLELRVEATPGHSSAPPPETAIGILAKAVAVLEANPFPAKLAGPMREMLEAVGPEMNFPMRLVMANLWLLDGVVQRRLEGMPATGAALRTTTAPAIFEAGTKENVLPGVARAVLNFRIMPGETIATVLDHVRDTIDDPRVRIEALPSSNDPTPVSDVDCAAYEVINVSLRQVFPDTIVAPGLVLGGTDSQHFVNVAANVYKMAPFPLREEDLARIHGTNERVAVEDYVKAIQFYAQLMRNATG